MFEEFLHKLRFDSIQPSEDDGAYVRHTLWGRFSLECWYNMDQVSLTFVNGQDDTFTVEDDDYVNVKFPQESLRKRQFTVNLVFNAGSDNKAYGWCGFFVNELVKKSIVEKRSCGMIGSRFFGRRRLGLIVLS